MESILYIIYHLPHENNKYKWNDNLRLRDAIVVLAASVHWDGGVDLYRYASTLNVPTPQVHSRSVESKTRRGGV